MRWLFFRYDMSQLICSNFPMFIYHWCSLLPLSVLLFILDLFYVQSLEFDLIVYAPYRSIEGFVSDMEVNLACLNFFVGFGFLCLHLYNDDSFWVDKQLFCCKQNSERYLYGKILMNHKKFLSFSKLFIQCNFIILV